MDERVVGVEQRELVLEDLLPSPDAGPDAAYARDVLLGRFVGARLSEPPEGPAGRPVVEAPLTERFLNSRSVTVCGCDGSVRSRDRLT
jgi:hypothetical protein